MTVSLFVFVLVVGNLVREVIDELASGRLSLGMFAYLVALLIPGVIPYALPLGLLTGILLVLGRMSAQNEIMAMKASGISLYSIASPVLLIALLGSALSVGINFYYAPAADAAYRTSLRNIVRDNPLQFIQPRQFIHDFPGFVIYVGDREGDTLRDFWLWELDDHWRVIRFIKAQEGNFHYNEDEDAMVLTLKQGVAEQRRDADPENIREMTLLTVPFEQVEFDLPLTLILGGDGPNYRLSLMTLNELLEARTTWNPGQRERTPEEAFADRIKVQMQIQKNFAMAFSILSMAGVAIPLGIKASRTETFFNLVIALLLAFTYYMLVVAISWLENHPHLRPDLLIWLPNLFFQSLGIWLLVRANRH